MVLSVAGKHALITGGGSGINLAFARLLLNKGCSVMIADLALRPETQSVLSQYLHPTSPSNPIAIFHRTNVVSWPQLSSLWSKTLSSFPTIDIVVPGAGIFEPRWSNFWEPPKSQTNPNGQSMDDASRDPGGYTTLDINLVAPMRLSQMAIGHWTQNKQKGCLVHVSSQAGYVTAINTPLYFASKHGVHGFVRSLGGLRDEIGIRCSAIAPGAVRTPLWIEDPDKKDMITDDFMEPEEVAEAMYELVVNEDFGNGTIYECTKGATRVVPETPMPHSNGKSPMIQGYVDDQKNIYNMLKTTGLKV